MTMVPTHMLVPIPSCCAPPYGCVSDAGILAEQFVSNGPRFHLYDRAEQQWEQLMIWQHSTMYLFFALSGATTLTVHMTDVAPLALDRLILSIAFFNEGHMFTHTGYDRV